MPTFPAFRVLALSALFALPALFPLRNTAQTSFSANSIYNSPGFLTIQAHGDFNNDGREDLVVLEYSAASGGNRNLLFLSNDDGTYDPPITLNSVAAGAGQFIVGDFNHDGNLDYAVLDIAGQGIDVYTGHGDGTFTFPVVLSTVARPLAIVAVDLNHDNVTDIIVVSEPFGAYGRIDIWLANGNQNGRFTAGQTITPEPLPTSYATVGDFDGDGNPDLVLVDPADGPQVQVFYGDGAGKLVDPLFNPTHLFGLSAGDRWDVNAIGDIDGNGTSDLVMVQGGASATAPTLPQLVIVKGNSDRTLSDTTIDTPNGCPSSAIAIADYNGDGMNDLVDEEGPCSGTGPMNIVVTPATGAGVFSSNEQVIYSSTLSGPLVNVKSTQGTRPDLAFTENAQGTGQNLVLLQNTGSGSFPGCGTTSQATGLNVCGPAGSTADSPVNFSISAAGPTPMRTVAVWADGQKVAEQLTHAFSKYSFLDQSVALSAGTHNITIYGTGWDNTLQRQDLTLTVGNGGGCGAPPSPGVNVCKPANGSTVGSPTEVSATANITGTLARMEIWVDGVKKFTETTGTTFDTNLNLAAGYHQFDIYAVNTQDTKWETTVTVQACEHVDSRLSDRGCSNREHHGNPGADGDLGERDKDVHRIHQF